MTAYNLILENKEKVEKIANTILEEQEIYGDDLVRLLDEQDFQRPADRLDRRDGLAEVHELDETSAKTATARSGDDKTRRRLLLQ